MLNFHFLPCYADDNRYDNRDRLSTKNGRVDLKHRHRPGQTFSIRDQGMTSTHSSRKSRGDKPAKPSKDYPLTPHGNGQWCKKIKGKVWFFGTWDDPQAALEKYVDEKDDILAGRDPKRLSQSGTKLVDLVNRFLTDRQQKVTEGTRALVTPGSSHHGPDTPAPSTEQPRDHNWCTHASRVSHPAIKSQQCLPVDSGTGGRSVAPACIAASSNAAAQSARSLAT